MSSGLVAACGDDEGTGSGTTAGNGSTAASTEADPTGQVATDTPSNTTGDDPSSGSATTTAADSTTNGTDPDSSGTTSGAAPCEGMSFFATSVGSGEAGGDLGGLDGADATCQMLADAVGQGACTWHAYLSTSTEDARDRIGTGPWENAMGDVVADSVEALHTDGLPNGMPQLVLDENGVEVPGNQHDILTGSQEDGTLLPNATCADWTSGEPGDEAGVGHSDIRQNPQFSPSWNAAHVVGGCRPQDLQSTGGAGRLYCFAL